MNLGIKENKIGQYFPFGKKKNTDECNRDVWLEYKLDVKAIKLKDNENFQVKLFEKGIINTRESNNIYILSYSYQRHFIGSPPPNGDFIRFDFEPFKEKYAKTHINTPKKSGRII